MMRWGYIINNPHGNKLKTAIAAIFHFTVLIVNQLLVSLVLYIPGAKKESLEAMEKSRLVTKANIPYKEIKYQTNYGMEFMASFEKLEEVAIV